MRIIGAGLSGLIAATQFPNAKVFERQPSLPHNHHALLRFRTPDIGKAVHIPFRKVKVFKAIWRDFALHNAATITDMNHYSGKVAGQILSRSISDLEPVERYVAPLDFIRQLYDQVFHRVELNAEFDGSAGTQPVISTIPMKFLAKAYSETMLDDLEFKSTGIIVQRFWIPNADVFQTIYYPEPWLPIYRASITGDTLIVESVRETTMAEIRDHVFDPFGITAFNSMDTVSQSLGKIVPVDNNIRQAFIMKMTANYQVYALGRFATWRNILLDDVLIDIERIKKMLEMGSYHRYLKGAGK